MTGGKPDNLIRTPMAWTRTGPHAGFTTGTPWEPLASDSLEANVEVRNKGPLLEQYRRLIHLRAVTPALAHGQLVPIVTDNKAVVAFERRDAGERVLVLANISADSVKNLSVTLASDAVSPGRFAAKTLFGATSRWSFRRTQAPGNPFRIDVPTFGPYSGTIIRLTGSRTPRF